MFRAGEVHGRITERVQEVCRLVGLADSAMVTSNLWGERWSKLVTNAMANGISACTGLPSGEMVRNFALRSFATKVGSEAIRVGQALGYQLEEINHLDPEIIAKAGEGDKAQGTLREDRRLAGANRSGVRYDSGRLQPAQRLGSFSRRSTSYRSCVCGGLGLP